MNTRKRLYRILLVGLLLVGVVAVTLILMRHPVVKQALGMRPPPRTIYDRVAYALEGPFGHEDVILYRPPVRSSAHLANHRAFPYSIATECIVSGALKGVI